MLALATILTLSAFQPWPTQYQLRIDVIRGADTVRTTFRIEEGLEGRALVGVSYRVTVREADAPK